MNVAVVGAGIAGLLTALHLSMNRSIDRVVVFEKREAGGLPRKHCSGVISKDTLTRIPYASKFVENSYNTVELYTFSGLSIELIFDKDSIYRIDRVSHEKTLTEILLSRGVYIEFDSEVMSIEHSGDGYRLRVGSGWSRPFDRVVIAEGYPPRLALAQGFKFRSRPLMGLQQDVLLERRLSEEAVSRLYVAMGIDEGFAWFIPITDRKAVIGIASGTGSGDLIEVCRKFFEKRLGFSVGRVVDIYGGIVLRGYPSALVVGGVIGIGDAVATVKSVSGGGLYPIAIISKLIGENIHRMHIVERELRGVLNQLRAQYKVYRFSRLMLNLFRRPSPLKKVVIELGSSSLYDHHEKLLMKTATGLKKLAVDL